MRTIGRLGASILGLTTLVAGWALASDDAHGMAIRPGIVVFAEDPAQRQLARWAVTRFERAGLDAPTAEIRFHSSLSGCGGHLGYAQIGRVDVCTVLVNEMARRNLLHEMSHIWIDQNISRATRERFLGLRHLSAWNDSSDPWPERGCEQGAEIMAWALGDRILTPQVPDNEPARLHAAYRLLTGGGAPPDWP
jgi:hypothetical protein